jgi:hypothetical protein
MATIVAICSRFNLPLFIRFFILLIYLRFYLFVLSYCFISNFLIRAEFSGVRFKNIATPASL